MSEWWEGKTLEELRDTRIRATYTNGVTLTGKLNCAGGITLPDDEQLMVLSTPYGSYARYKCEWIQSVERLDDPDYERIDDFDDVHSGDIAVFTNGNRHQVGDVDHEDRIIRLRILETPGNSCWADDRMFAYALRPKPQLPDKPGLWLDKEGDLWMNEDAGTRCIRSEGTGWQCGPLASMSELNTCTPFRPCPLDTDHE
ncbi:hypothetical protein [Bifidobacterium platyrrhinorum]|uniref:Uncharacterized protein n=1 Tax=Bifidobacterium platyrrhinorum TaxID=2661628 RepID=A0A6L9SS71_9BIFI|nr:hypothetical protein [Bifidobacterium platyrrhinorum]NEG55416.1 hypothetical protein [Bifidobacterium platyrrhinorum]